MSVPANVIFIWPSTNASIPSGGWSRETGLDDKYPKGNAAGVDPGVTGGATTHSHTTAGHVHTTAHTHTTPDSGAGSGTTARDASNTNPADTHTHVSNPSTTNPTTSLASDTPSTSTDSHEPAYFKVIFIKSDGTPGGVPANAVGVWSSTTLPTNWNLCDGGSGRPDIRNRVLKGAATGADGGSTGGSDTHTHTIASHTHSTPYAHTHPDVTSSQTASGLPAGTISGGQAGTATATHTHAMSSASGSPAITGNTDSAASDSSLPPYLVPGFIQNNGSSLDLPNGMIGLWGGTLATIPQFWYLCDGTNGTPDYRGQFLRCSNTTGGIGGAGGGSLTHGSTHTTTGHTHAVASHLHAVTGAAGAGENRTAGSTNAATTAHTHTWGNTGSTSFTSGSGSPTVNNYTDTQPPFKTVAYIQYQAPTTRGPLIIPTPKLPSQAGVATVAMNLLLTTLAAPPVQAPFYQTHWPLPERPAAVVRAADPVPNLLLSTLRAYDPCPAGPYLPRSAVNDNSIGSVAWNNPANVDDADGTYATVTLAAQQSNYIVTSRYGFNIAPTKTIVGIKVEVRGKTTGTACHTDARIVKGGVIQQDSIIGTDLTGTESTIVLGGPTELWSRAWTPADINSDDFGAAINVQTETDTISVDFVRITVYCTELIFAQYDWPLPPLLPKQPFSPGQNLLSLPTLSTNPFNQSDWPNPPAAKTQRRVEFEPSLDLTTRVSPFAQYDWPNPPPSKTQRNVESEPTQLLTTASNIPTKQSDWPLPPTLPQVSRVPVGTNALGQVTLATNPFNQDEWLIPQKAKVAAQSDTYSTNNLTLTAPTAQYDWPIPQKGKVIAQADNESSVGLTTTSAVPFTPTDVSLQIAKTKTQSFDPVPNLLGTTLVPAVVAAPFSLSDWPNPPRFPIVIPRHSTERMSFGQPAAQPIQNSQNDWPLPPKSPEKLHYFDVLNLVLIGPFNQDQWPNPIAIKQQQPEVGFNLTIRLPSQVVVPFNQDDWTSNPKLPSQPIAIGENALDIITLGLNPFNQDDWTANPRLPLHLPLIGHNALDLSTLANNPFNLDDWPNPPKLQPQQPAIGENALDITTLGLNPFNQDDWNGNPPPRKIIQPDILPNLTILLPQPFVQSPFSLSDWPNPPSTKTQRFDVGENALDLVTLSINPVSLGHNFDWPIPRAITSPIDIRVIIENITPILVSLPNIKPFSQSIWPVPPGLSQLSKYVPFYVNVTPLQVTSSLNVVTNLRVMSVAAGVNVITWDSQLVAGVISVYRAIHGSGIFTRLNDPGNLGGFTQPAISPFTDSSATPGVYYDYKVGVD